MNTFLTVLLYAVLVMLLASQPRADDIDVYRGSPGAGEGPSRVMLALGLGMGGTELVCENAADEVCSRLLGDEVYGQLDLFGPTRDARGGIAVAAGADGVADPGQVDPLLAGQSIATGHWRGARVDRYDLLRAVLRVVLANVSDGMREAPARERVEVGLMAMHAETCSGAGPGYSPDYSGGDPRGCSQGAYILQGFTDIAIPANLERLLLKLAALPEPGKQAAWMVAPWAGHSYRLKDIYLELFRYLSGGQVFSGFLGIHDYGSRAMGNLYHGRLGGVSNDVLPLLPDGTADEPILAPDTDIMLAASFELGSNNVSAARYISPLSPLEECPRIALVNLQLGASGRSHPDTSAAIAALPAAGGMGVALGAGAGGDLALVAAVSGIDAGEGVSGVAGIPAVRSYFFKQDSGPAQQRLAAAGGAGRAYSLAADPRSLVDSLTGVFSRAVSVSATLVAGATPFDGSGRSAAASDIYFALFRTESGPPWPGNIKKLKIIEVEDTDLDTGAITSREVIVQAPLDGAPVPALSEEDGRILPDALTFWTDPEGDDVLAHDAAREEVPGRDGRSVVRGGAGQQVAGFLEDAIGAENTEPGARQLFTLDPMAAGELLALGADEVTRLALSELLDPADSLDEAGELQVLNWLRGQDSFDMDGDGDHSDSRAWVMADPLHSRPLAINYGARPGTAYDAGNPDIRLFFGTNDGIFHVVRNTKPDGSEAGSESWAFIPPEMLAMQSRLAQNRSGALEPHPYGMDGEAVAHVVDRDRDGNIEADEGDVVWVFIGQRRGGRGIYAFDMTDPDSPRFKWWLNHATPGFGQLALTFSTPRPARLDLGRGGVTPVLVFAGGYNGGWAGARRVGKDAGAAPDLVGNAIYVVDAEDGSLVWQAVGPSGQAAPESGDRLHYVAELTHSIPSPVTVIDVDHNGVEDRAYVGDSGGNLWGIELTEYARRDLEADAGEASGWYVTKLASLGGGGAADRRFFHAPDVVQSRDSNGDYAGIVIVAGNRAAPVETAARNFAYLLKDRRVAGVAREPEDDSAPVIGHGALVDITERCLSSDADTCEAADLARGWKLELQSPGEKGLSTPLVSNGKVLFTSYLPSDETGGDACAQTEGHGRVYVVKLADGAPGLPPVGELDVVEAANRYRSLGPGMHGDVVPYGSRVLVPGRGISGTRLVAVPGSERWRAYWRQDEVDTL